MTEEVAVSGTVALPSDGSELHPLDPLLPAEIRLARTIVSSVPGLSGDLYFAVIRLREPSKETSEGFVPATG